MFDRLEKIQVGCPYSLYVAGFRRGSMLDEKDLHDDFSGFHLRGEWFERSKSLLNYIENRPDVRAVKVT